MRVTTRFKKLIQDDDFLILPGVHDALSGRIAEAEGFDAVTMGGFATTGTLLGQPDSSQLGAQEMADHYARVCDAISIPVFVDGDTGFGNVTNVARTIRQFERAGVGGLFIEDQVFPKRCGHTPGKQVVPLEDMLGKLKAALDARHDPDLVIMGRTDALAVHGIDEAIDRANAFVEAGCDLIFVEAPRNAEDMARICREVPAPQLANMVDFGDSPELTAAELSALGYATAVWPVSSIFAVAYAVRELMQKLRQDGTTKTAQDRMLTFDDYTNLVGLPELRSQEQHYLDEAKQLMNKNIAN
jgi:methylisocitrate lyase